MLADVSFRRWLKFFYLPTNRQGEVAIAAFLAIEGVIGALSFLMVAESALWWLFALTMFAIFLAFWEFVETHLESD